MSLKSNIQWTDATWNIARGCTKVDADCKFCYMYRDSFDSHRYNPLQVVRTKTVFDMPLKYKETVSACWPGRPLIFTCSLTDFFHEDIDSYRHEAWDIIRKCPHLIFQILTKRPERIKRYLPDDWGQGWNNVWLGTSVGSPAGLQRVVDLSQIDAKVKFLSIEPLHQPLKLFHAVISVKLWEKYEKFSVLPNFQWVIVGGESGNDTGKYRYRECKEEWLESIISECRRSAIPVFVKQMGTHIAKEKGYKDRHGGNIAEWPEYLQIRQFPRL